MNTKQTTCDDRALRAMLRTENGDREQEAILKHIEQWHTSGALGGTGRRP